MVDVCFMFFFRILQDQLHALWILTCEIYIDSRILQVWWLKDLERPAH